MSIRSEEMPFLRSQQDGPLDFPRPKSSDAFFLKPQVLPEPEPDVGMFADRQLKQEQPVLLSGGIGLAFLFKVKEDHETGYQREDVAVFKPIDSKRVESEHLQDLQENPEIDEDPDFVARNIATCEVARLLGFDVVVKTAPYELPPSVPMGPRVASSNGWVNTTLRPDYPRSGLLMAAAKGETAEDAFDRDRTLGGNARLCRDLTKLQLLDHLVANLDRNRRNYSVDTKGDVTVAGFDHDRTFSSAARKPQPSLDKLHTKDDYRVLLPPVVDTVMAVAISSISPDELVAALPPSFTKEQVKATLERLDAMKTHLAGLNLSGRIIKPDQWDTVLDLFDKDNSYFGRDFPSDGSEPLLNTSA